MLSRLLLLAQEESGTTAGMLVADALTSAEQAKAFIQDRGLQFIANLATAIVIYVAGMAITKILRGIVRRGLARASVDATLTSFLVNIAYAGMLTFVILASLNRLGIDTTSLAAAIAAAGLAVGLALQNSLSNFAAGVMLILMKPFAVGHFVEAGGTSGIVEEIAVFHTILKTPDNLTIVVPNGSITSGTIKNYSAKPIRRIDLEVGCGYDDDLRDVRSLLGEILQNDERILSDPEPFIGVAGLGDSSVNWAVRPWVESADYWNTRCDLLERIKLAFDARGLSIPYPQRDVHIHQESSVG